MDKFSALLLAMKAHKKLTGGIVGAIFVLCVVIIVSAVSCSKEEGDSKESQQDEIVTDAGQEETDSEETTDLTVDYTIPDVELEENAHADVNALVDQYFNAMTNGDTTTCASLIDEIPQEELIKIEKESAYIDEFDNIVVYTKPGPMSGSHVAFVYYEIKFTGIDTLAPGLTTLYICPKEDGSLYICDAGMTDQDSDYVKALVAQSDVADIFRGVETKYGEARDADPALNDFMNSLSEKLDQEVSEAMAQLNGGAQEEQPQETETQEAQSQTVEELVRATDTVNVRASDSENADRIGRVAMGETITRYEVKANGWSRVSYEGNEGYIKSEYLESVETADNTESEDTETAAPETEEETQESTGTSLAGKDKITIKEAVNVRKSASTSADKLGMAYQGETYELIMEQADGWCKIKFKGETGYVKTEFVE